MERLLKESIPWYLFLGFSIASIGGPIAIAFLFFFYSITDFSYALSASILAFLLFLFPILVWLRYSKKVSSSGGLYTFAKEAAGKRYAFVQGVVWLISYFLYLPFTVTFIVYFLFGPLFGYSMLLPLLEITLPVVIAAIMLAGTRKGLLLISAIAVLQILVMLYFGFGALATNGVKSNLLPSGLNPGSLLKQSVVVALFFICADLPLFLGGEVEGRSRTIRKLLPVAYVVVALLIVFSSIFLLGTANGMSGNGQLSVLLALKNNYGRIIVDLVYIFVILSTFALIIAEYFAISRLMHSMFKMKIRTSIAYVASVFIALDIVSLFNPTEFYNYLVFPSLICLYVSQLMVFIVYPLFAKRHLQLSLFDMVLTVVSSGLMLYGLYSVLAGGLPY